MAGYFAEALHSLKGLPNVIDIRNIGLVGGVELDAASRAQPTKRAFDVFLDCYDKRRAGAHHRRHHRAVAAADHRALAHRPAGRALLGGAIRRAA